MAGWSPTGRQESPQQAKWQAPATLRAPLTTLLEPWPLSLTRSPYAARRQPPPGPCSWLTAPAHGAAVAQAPALPSPKSPAPTDYSKAVPVAQLLPFPAPHGASPRAPHQDRTFLGHSKDQSAAPMQPHGLSSPRETHCIELSSDGGRAVSPQHHDTGRHVAGVLAGHQHAHLPAAQQMWCCPAVPTSAALAPASPTHHCPHPASLRTGTTGAGLTQGPKALSSQQSHLPSGTQGPSQLSQPSPT